MTEPNKWDQWLESDEGKGAMEPSILKPGNEEYLKNRLWWAFHAGVYPIDGTLETKEMQAVKAAITAEVTRRREELKKKLEELEGEGK